MGPKTAVGGYGGLAVVYSPVADKPGALVGAEGALLLGHAFSIGIAGFGWTRDDVYGPDDSLGYPRKLRFGYGGGVVRYAFQTGTPFYASVGAIVGAGALGLQRRYDDQIRRDDTDRFFVFEPQLRVHANVVRWMRVGLQGGYRLTAVVAKVGYGEADFNGLTAGGNVEFGWF
jgi:hypothetical protein